MATLKANLERIQTARYILHPTDFSDQSELALAHALRLTLANQCDLDLLHVGKNSREGWDEFPSIRTYLTRWGLIDKHATREKVGELGIEVGKIVADEEDLIGAVKAYCKRHPIDLVVLSTAGRQGLASWIKPSKAERIADSLAKSAIATLFVPRQCHGCVDIASGEVTMNQVLVPIDHTPSGESALARGVNAIRSFGDESAHLTLLHVGTESDFPVVDLPETSWTVRRVVREGNPAAEILAMAEELKANLIVMVTDGEHGFLDVLRGTTTEQVLRRARCPVLAIPAT